MLLGEIVTSKMEVFISIVEDMRTILRSTDSLRFLLAMTHRNPIRQDLNYNESAALIDAHLKRYKFHTEDDNCCFAVIHRLDNFRCNIACERPRSELLDVFNDRRNCGENATDHCL